MKFLPTGITDRNVLIRQGNSCFSSLIHTFLLSALFLPSDGAENPVTMRVTALKVHLFLRNTQFSAPPLVPSSTRIAGRCSGERGTVKVPVPLSCAKIERSTVGSNLPLYCLFRSRFFSLKSAQIRLVPFTGVHALPRCEKRTQRLLWGDAAVFFCRVRTASAITFRMASAFSPTVS